MLIAIANYRVYLVEFEKVIRQCSMETEDVEIRSSDLSNDFSLEPGELAFVYHRRWDEEKFFDNFKNDLANTKAWGKSPIAIEQQAIIGLITYILTRLFLERQFDELPLPDGDTTQFNKQQKKQNM